MTVLNGGGALLQGSGLVPRDCDERNGGVE